MSSLGIEKSLALRGKPPPGLQSLRGSYVFEASIKDLQLPLGEVGLGLKLLQSLGPMANHGHLQLIFNLIWNQRRWHWSG